MCGITDDVGKKFDMINMSVELYKLYQFFAMVSVTKKSAKNNKLRNQFSPTEVFCF